MVASSGYPVALWEMYDPVLEFHQSAILNSWSISVLLSVLNTQTDKNDINSPHS